MSTYTIRLLEAEIVRLEMEKMRLVEINTKFQGEEDTDSNNAINRIDKTIASIQQDIKTLGNEATIDKLV